uniref:G_PROTEIN_RECEP_F1_2 domain-containing protein n=1 Tax=Strongyloides papillosus TaxID=174720 RepID=A0A0N5B7N0_STREA
MNNSIIYVNAEKDWIVSATIYLSIGLFFYAPNTLIIFFAKTKSKIKPDTFRVVTTASVTSIISLFLTSLCSYLWWFSYLTNIKVSLTLSNTTCQVRFFGQNLIFVIPFIVSVWRFNVLVTKLNLNFLCYFTLFILSMCPTIYSFIDSVMISKNIAENDIFTYNISYTSPFVSFLYFITQILSPSISLCLSFIILSKIRKHIKMTRKITSSDNHMQYLTYSLITNSITPIVGGLPNFVCYTLFSFGFTIERIYWNFSEAMLLLLGGMTPLLMIVFMPSFKSQFISFLCCRINQVLTTEVFNTKTIPGKARSTNKSKRLV